MNHHSLKELTEDAATDFSFVLRVIHALADKYGFDAKEAMTFCQLIDPNEVDGRGRNALHLAAQEGYRLPLFHRILGMIHNVNAVDNKGRTALMKAARDNHLDMVVSLMNHQGIDLNVQNRYNSTALHYAVFADCPAIVAQLVSDDRVDTSLKDKYNRTPLKYAIHNRRPECAKILREHGAPEE